MFSASIILAVVKSIIRFYLTNLEGFLSYFPTNNKFNQMLKYFSFGWRLTMKTLISKDRWFREYGKLFWCSLEQTWLNIRWTIGLSWSSTYKTELTCYRMEIVGQIWYRFCTCVTRKLFYVLLIKWAIRLTKIRLLQDFIQSA